MVGLVCVGAVLAASLVAVRTLDGRRDRHSQVLISVVQLGDLFGQEDAATTSGLLAPLASRSAELSASTVQIDQRLAYLRHQGLGAADTSALRSCLDRYRGDATRTGTGGPGGRPPLLAADSARCRALLQRVAVAQKAAFARYDSALDAVVVSLLLAGLAGVVVAAGRRWKWPPPPR